MVVRETAPRGWRVRRAVALVALALTVVVAVGVIARPPATSAWRVVIGPDPVAMVVDAPAGRLYVMDHRDGVLRAIDTASGALVRRIAVGGSGPVAVDTGSGHIFVADAWNGPDRTGVYTDHAVVHMLDGRSGALIRTIALGVDEDVLALLAEGVQTGGGGRVVAVCASVALVLDARSGAVLRRIRAGATPYAAAAALDPARGRAFVLTSNARALDVLDVGRGTIVRMVVLGGYLTGVAVDRSAGRVVIADAARGGQVRLLDEETLRLVGSLPVGDPPVAVAAGGHDASIIVAVDARRQGGGPGSRGHVLVVDGYSGLIRRRVSVTGTPALVTVDPRGNHLFVGVLDDTGAGTPDPWDGLPAWLRRWLPWARPPTRGADAPNMVETIDPAG
jgi:DNA-binding beta-propeller fold protein YncE